LDTTELRAMHYMMFSHDLAKSPSRYGKGPIYVDGKRADRAVYTAPEPADVPALMEALAAEVRGQPIASISDRGAHVTVRDFAC
jgi:hypothetical protein